MHSNKYPPSGFTLIELLISLSISFFIIVAALSILTSFLKSQSTSLYINELTGTSEQILSDMTQEIHNAFGADITANCLTLLDEDENNLVSYCHDQDTNELKKHYFDSDITTTLTSKSISVVALGIRDTSGNSGSPETEQVPPLIEIKLELIHRSRYASATSLTKQTTISVRKNQTAAFSGPVSEPCTTGAWVLGSCGTDPCLSGERMQTRAVSPLDCAPNFQCVSDTSCESNPSCTCESWTAGTCGGSCPSDQRQETRVCTPTGCAAESRCVSDSTCTTSVCNCTTWESHACGEGVCAPHVRLKTRTCSPTNCASTSQCVSDTSCSLIITE